MYFSFNYSHYLCGPPNYTFTSGNSPIDLNWNQFNDEILTSGLL